MRLVENDIDREIDELIHRKPVKSEDDGETVEFVPVENERSKEGVKEKSRLMATDLEKIKDNIKFANEVQDNPVVTDKYDKRVFNCDVININPYIEQQAWPSSLYFIDKLIRLNTKASLEWMKRYLSKKRHVPMNMIWLLILLFAVGIVIVIVLFLILPMIGGGI